MKYEHYTQKISLKHFPIKEIIIHNKSLQSLKYQYIIVEIKHEKYESILNINSHIFQKQQRQTQEKLCR